MDNKLLLEFNENEIREILNLLSEMPVKTGAAGIFGIIKERAELAFQRKQNENNPEPV